MKEYAIFKKMWLFGLLLLSCFAFSCDDDDDDDILPDNEVSFENIQLLGANEVPAVTSSGSGTLNATYNRDTNILSFTVTWTLGDVNDQVTASHFHGPASVTETASPVIPVTFSSTNYTGSFTGTTRALTQDEEDDLLDGQWYFNIHSNAFPGGELRGQLVSD